MSENQFNNPNYVKGHVFVTVNVLGVVANWNSLVRSNLFQIYIVVLCYNINKIIELSIPDATTADYSR